MPLRRWWERAQALPGAPGACGVSVDGAQYLQLARDAAGAGARLLSLWAAGPCVYAAYLGDRGVLVAQLADSRGTAVAAAPLPGLGELFPVASRLERALLDLSGVRSSDPDQRPWLWHGAWPRGWAPLGNAPEPDAAHESPATGGAQYPFVRVEGEGVHEIAVGPVHAGIIEPGHFRFSVVGEKVLRLEEHLGYVHKGIERRFGELALLEGHRLAARVSGDSAVAFSWAYAQALEGMSGISAPPRARSLRALMLELERIANHLGDLGALGNDAGFAFGLSQFLRLKELLLRSIEIAFGQRYLLDAVVPGGTGCDLTLAGEEALAAQMRRLGEELPRLRMIYDEHSGVRDRFNGAGVLSPGLAARLGVVGLAARASGQGLDARVDLPCPPYDELAVRKCVRSEGDVAARVALRFDELAESCRLVSAILERLPSGAHRTQIEPPAPGKPGIGLIEGWRGPVLVALHAAEAGRIARCHPHDPSWQCWPALEHAIIGNIVPDFPLINKSFNLSYSGVDL